MAHPNDAGAPTRGKDAAAALETGDEPRIIDDLKTYLTRYARARPQTAALICLGVGFVLGWKLKPW